jgi:hypothetical protein
MPKFIVDLWLDGYETEEEMEEACAEFIYEQLNMTASGVKITKCSVQEGSYWKRCSNLYGWIPCIVTNVAEFEVGYKWLGSETSHTLPLTSFLHPTDGWTLIDEKEAKEMLKNETHQ